MKKKSNILESVKSFFFCWYETQEAPRQQSAGKKKTYLTKVTSNYLFQLSKIWIFYRLYQIAQFCV